MNVMDYATQFYFDIERVRLKLDSIENCGDLEEAIADVQEISAELHSIQQDMNTSFDLRMEEE